MRYLCLSTRRNYGFISIIQIFLSNFSLFRAKCFPFYCFTHNKYAILLCRDSNIQGKEVSKCKNQHLFFKKYSNIHFTKCKLKQLPKSLRFFNKRLYSLDFFALNQRKHLFGLTATDGHKGIVILHVDLTDILARQPTFLI